MDARTANLVGAWGTALHDRVEAALTGAAGGRSGAASALLAVLLAEPGLTVQELSGVLGISGSGTVRLLDRLSGDGLADRRPGPDGRSIAVHLSSTGEAAARQVLAARRRAVEAATECLADGELAHLLAAVEKMLAAMTVDERTGSVICRLCDWQACPQDECPVEQAEW